VSGRKAWLLSLLLLLTAVGATRAADPSKVLRVAFPVDVTGFDPQSTSDAYSTRISRAIFDSLLQYDFLKRPYELAPSTAESLPEIKDGGRTFVFKLKKGIYFALDPVFKGKPRELVAEDYVYAWKRLLDPHLAAPWNLLVNGKFVGADAVVAKARAAGGRFDYDARIEGLQALDRYTLQVKLVQPDYILIENMTTTPMAAVAREVIEAYADPQTGRAMDHPVGTGAFMLKDWRRGSKITLAANPGFREEYFPVSRDPKESPLVLANAGKRLPIIGQVEISIIEESNPRLLAFNSRQIDYLHLPLDLTTSVIENGALKPDYARQQVVFTSDMEPSFFYTYFNMDDPVVGGYTPDKIALRRAIAMAYNVTDEIRIIRQGQAIAANQPISPGLLGHDPNAARMNPYDPAAARALLERFGYKDRDGDGYRELPDGRAMVLVKGSTTDTEGRLFDEVWKKSMDAIGIKVEFIKQKWPDLLKMSQAGKLQMWTVGRSSGIRDGGVNLEILATRNIANTMNDSRFSLPEYDRLFEQSRLLPDSPERTALYRKMSELVGGYAPLVLGVYRYENLVAYPWVLGFKRHAFLPHPWKYLDIDLARRNAG
jgi:oligopeptide transport system substrate-binding protein